jgi:hypothetical protein
VAPQPATNPLTTAGVVRFRCIGTDCEDNCCHGWDVPLDRLSYDRLKRALGRSRTGPDEFRAAVQRQSRPGRTDAHHASMRMVDPGARCPFETRTRLCSVHARFGAEALPAICAAYPRERRETNRGAEVWGFLSCPEMVRQCLLREDGMTLVTGPPALAAGLTVETTLDEASPYTRPFHELRARIHALFSRPLDLGARLSLLAEAAASTTRFFTRAANRLSDPDAAAFEVAFAALEAAPTPPAATVSENHRAAALVTALTSRLECEEGAAQLLIDVTRAPKGQKPEGDVDQIWRAHLEQRARWQVALPGRRALIFANFAQQHWLRSWYTRAPNLLEHTHALVVHVLLLDYLLHRHALLATLPDDRQAQRSAFDRAAVEVFYRFSRAIEHEPVFAPLLAAVPAELGLTAADAIWLARVV